MQKKREINILELLLAEARKEYQLQFLCSICQWKPILKYYQKESSCIHIKPYLLFIFQYIGLSPLLQHN